MNRWTAAAVVSAVLSVPAMALAADAPPYHDLNSMGGLYLCDKHGHSVSSGNIDDKPFAWYAVSRSAPPNGFGGAGASTTLYAYQPRKDAYPDRWNGDTMTAASGYRQGTPPTAVGTPLDFTLRDFLSAFPALWEGSVQLRMYFGSKANGYNGSSYVTADLKVQGTSWTMLSNPAGTCPDASHIDAQSSEITVAHLDPSASARPHPSASGASASHGPAATERSGNPSAAGAAVGGADGDAAKSANAARWSTVLARAGALVGLVALGSLVVTRVRRRSPAKS